MSIDHIGMMLLQKRVLRVDDVGDVFNISTNPNNNNVSARRRVGLHIRVLGSF